MGTIKAPPLDEQLCFDLYAASRAVTAAYRPALTQLGITYPLEETEPPGAELTERVRAQFRARGLTVY